MNINWLSISGLSLDLVGVWLLYSFAVIPAIGIQTEDYDDATEEEKIKRNTKISRIGIWIITFGFLLQALGAMSFDIYPK